MATEGKGCSGSGVATISARLSDVSFCTWKYGRVGSGGRRDGAFLFFLSCKDTNRKRASERASYLGVNHPCGVGGRSCFLFSDGEDLYMYNSRDLGDIYDEAIE